MRTHPAVCAGALLAAADGSGGWQRLPGRGENQNPLAIESNRHNRTLLAEEIIGRKTGNRSCTILPVECRVGVGTALGERVAEWEGVARCEGAAVPSAALVPLPRGTSAACVIGHYRAGPGVCNGHSR